MVLRYSALLLSLAVCACGLVPPRNKVLATAPGGAGHRALVAAAGGERPVESRLTGGFSYAPTFQGLFLRSGRSALPGNQAVRKAAREIYKEASLRATPEALQAKGLLYLVTNRPEKAVPILEQASRRVPQNAAILSDLAAAYIASAEALDRPINLVGALSAAEKATRLDSSSPEALFNRALACRKLFLPSQAAEALQRYLELDGSSGWAREATASLQGGSSLSSAEMWDQEKQRLQAAIRLNDGQAIYSIVNAFRQESREYAEEGLLLAWAHLWLDEHRLAAARALSSARVISEKVVETSGDRSVADMIAFIDQLEEGSSEFRLLVFGIDNYGKGLSLVKARQFSEAESSLARARSYCSRPSMPCRLWIEFLLARCAYQRSDLPNAYRLTKALLKDIDESRYPILAGRSQWLLGSALLGLARPAEALRAYQSALALFQQTGESEHQSAVHILLASALHELGDSPAAWRHRLRAIQALAKPINPNRLRLALTEAAFASLESGHTDAAVIIQTEALHLARKTNEPLALTTALLNRGLILFEAGRYRSALNDLEHARHRSSAIADQSVRENVVADLLLADGEVRRTRDPAGAIASLSAALRFHEYRRHDLRLPHALRLRAQAFLHLNEEAAAVKDLARAIDLLERERNSLPQGSYRLAFSSRSASAFDDMIALQVKRGDNDLAFDYSERARARVLLDWLSALPRGNDFDHFAIDISTQPRPVAALQSRLNKPFVLVSYKILGDTLLLWVVRSTSVQLVRIPVTASLLERQIDRLNKLARRDELAVRPEAIRLYDILIRPLNRLLQKDEVVTFVLDGSLYSLPLAALVNSQTGRTLIEERPFAVAPSLNVLVRPGQHVAREGFADGSILVIANPAFRRSLFADAHDLQGALEEGTRIGRLYRRPSVVCCRNATRGAFRGALGKYRILHFSGHAVLNKRTPLQSMLLLAPDRDSGTGVLYSRELLGPVVLGTELVILASCGSAEGAVAAGEGIGGIVWPLLARGVPTVIASLWNIEDQSTRRLLERFHERLTAGAPPVIALRHAQVEFLQRQPQSARRSLDWAAFQVYTAVVPQITQPKKEAI